MSQNRRFLKYARIDSFGAFSNKTVGPFSPHLNVVFGRNEAGKTTLTQFVNGVLFGWEDARGGKNTYKPGNAERSGALMFSETPDGDDVSRETSSSGEYEVSRARNVDGLQGTKEVVGDIDRETFRTMFLLTSDELRSLRNTSDVTARLLTAGSGTNASPAQALAEVNDRIQVYSSRAAAATESVARLTTQIKDARAKMQRALEESERFKAEDREYRELAAQRKSLSAKITALNSEIDALVAKRAQLQKIAEQQEAAKESIAQLKDESARYVSNAAEVANGFDESLLALDQLEERALRDQLDEFSEQQVHAAHSVDIAEENQRASQAAYDALIELESSTDHAASAARQRALQIVMSIVLPVVFVLFGLPLFMHGRTIGSLSFTGLGLALVALGAILAVGAFLLIARPKNDVSALDRAHARCAMGDASGQEETAKRACGAKQFGRAPEELARCAWACPGQRLIRQARSLLDEAKDARSDIALDKQRNASFAMRMANAEETLRRLVDQRSRLIDEIEKSDDGIVLTVARADLIAGPFDFAPIDALIDRKSAQRDELVSTLEHISLRYGRLEEQLAQAKLMHTYDEAKQNYQQLRTRLEDSKRDLTKLLIARRLLESAIATWESRSQPEVYQRASKLLELHDRRQMGAHFAYG